MLAATQICDVTLYVVFRIAVDHSTFHIQGMFSECLVVAQVEVYIVAIFRSDAQFAHFQVFVTEHLFDGRQAIRRGVYVGCLVFIVVGCQHDVQPFCEQIAFAIFQ